MPVVSCSPSVQYSSLCLSAILWFNDFFLFPWSCAQDVWLLSQIPSLFTDSDCILKRFPWPWVLPDLEKWSIFSDFSLTVHTALLVLNGLVALWLSFMWELIPGPNSRQIFFSDLFHSHIEIAPMTLCCTPHPNMEGGYYVTVMHPRWYGKRWWVYLDKVTLTTTKQTRFNTRKSVLKTILGLAFIKD